MAGGTIIRTAADMIAEFCMKEEPRLTTSQVSSIADSKIGILGESINGIETDASALG